MLLPLDALPRKILLQADYGPGVCLLVEGGMESLDSYDFPPDLQTRASNWVANYFEVEESPAGQTREEFNAEGHAIALEIKRVLGAPFSITYRFIAPDLDKDGAFVFQEVSI